MSRSRLLAERPAVRPAFAGVDPATVDGPSASVESQYERGLEAGRAEVREELHQALEQERKQTRATLEDGLRSLATAHERVLRECRDALVDLALEAASRMLRARIDADDPVAVRACEQALAALPGASGMRVRVHPDDQEALAAALQELPSATIELIEDGAISRGGCVVESASGSVDASVETATAELRNAATEGRERA